MRRCSLSPFFPLYMFPSILSLFLCFLQFFHYFPFIITSVCVHPFLSYFSILLFHCHPSLALSSVLSFLYEFILFFLFLNPMFFPSYFSLFFTSQSFCSFHIFLHPLLLSSLLLLTLLPDHHHHHPHFLYPSPTFFLSSFLPSFLPSFFPAFFPLSSNYSLLFQWKRETDGWS